MKRKNDHKDGFKDTEIGVIPNDWDVVELGYALKEVNIRAEEIEDYQDLTVLSLTKNSGLIPQIDRFDHRVAVKDVRKYKVVKKNWIAYNPYVIWEGAIHSLKNKKMGVVSPAYVVWECSLVDESYLDFILRTNLLIQQYNRYAAGAVNRRRSIKKKDFKKILIPYPPLSEQKKIAGVLSAVQEAKEKTGEVIKAAKELKQSLMKHLFTYGPVSIEEAENVKLKETEIGMIPEEWETVNLNSVCSLRKETIDPKNSESLHYIGLEHIVPGDLKIRKYGNSSSVKSTKHVFYKGDILYGKLRPYLNKVAIPEMEGICSTDIMVFKVNANIINIDYLAYYLHSKPFLEYATITMTGVNHPRTSWTKLKNYPIPFPAQNIQRKISDYLSSIDQKIEAEENKKKALEELFKSLLNNLMTGKIRVNNLNIDV